ncbi:hypothetical protein FRC08_004021 [Ceratobasidium sp. 394]|nr:hypothetical protein FRC08_004021 [Ceratobasidium sp. 394]
MTKTCDIRCTPFKGGNFTKEEMAWLERFVPRVQELTANSGAGAGREREEFYTDIETQFMAKFIYHAPALHTDFEFTQEQKDCAWDDHEVSMLRSRLRTKLSARARKPKDEQGNTPTPSRKRKQSGHEGRARCKLFNGPRISLLTRLQVPTEPLTIAEPRELARSSVDREQPRKSTASARTSKPERQLDELTQALVDLGPCYLRGKRIINDYKRAVRDARMMVEDNWAEVSEEVLRE